MSTKYPGGFITKDYVAPTPSAATGIWTLDQQMQAQKTGTWPIQPPPPYIEDVFSTWLYTGNSSTQTITNNINLSGKGGLVWIKARNTSFNFNQNLSDTNRGTGKFLSSNTTAAAGTDTNDITAFNTTGFAIGSNQRVNDSAYRYVSWTFREQAKFFDVVTYTGTGSNTTIAHNLGSVPGCIIVKCTSTTGSWQVYHRSLTSAAYQLELNTTSAEFSDPTIWNSTAPTSTVFSVGTNLGINGSGRTYVAYIFAHNAGGFGPNETDNVISCGTFTTDGTGAATVNLGYEPQWVMFKDTVNADGWYMFDNMRGMSMTSSARTTANGTFGDSIDSPTLFFPSATGFTLNAGLVSGSAANIYIAIRRGPMKTPTVGTSVFSPIASAAAGGTQLTTNFPVDLQMYGVRAGDAANITTSDRLRGVSTTNTAGGNFIVTSSTAAETGGSYTRQWGNTGFVMPAGIGSQDGIFWNFQRAPGFFDEVCYTGTGSATTFVHNLGVVPELMITKCRGDAFGWAVYSSAVGNTAALFLESTGTPDTNTAYWNDTTPTSTVFSVGSASRTNRTSLGMVAYLFATLAGVSKVGSYTGLGIGTPQTINCGFTSGARFVLIKRTDFNAPWYVWDSARGIVAGNDPYLVLNSTAAEVTGTDYVNTTSVGFTITSTAPNAINASGGSYIFLAIS